MYTTFCPLCLKKLSLRQIDLNTAVFICDDLKCAYPVGYECVVITRKLEDINRKLELEDSTENWLMDFIPKPTASKVVQSSVAEKRTESIDDLIEATISDLSVQSYKSCNESGDKQVTNEEDLDDLLDFMFDCKEDLIKI